MKKILLTALVVTYSLMLSGISKAEISLSGYQEFYGGSADQSIQNSVDTSVGTDITNSSFNGFSNGRFTCPVAGLYQFTIIGLIADSGGQVAGGNYFFWGYFTKNGETNSDAIDDVATYHFHITGNAGGYPYLNYTDTYQLAANDVIGFRIQTGGFYGNNSDYYSAKFMGHLIG